MICILTATDTQLASEVLQVRLHVLRTLTVTDTNTERPEFIRYTNLGESKSPKTTEDFFFLQHRSLKYCPYTV